MSTITTILIAGLNFDWTRDTLGDKFDPNFAAKLQQTYKDVAAIPGVASENIFIVPDDTI